MSLDSFTLEHRLLIYDTFLKTEDTNEVIKCFKKQYPSVDVPHKETIHNLVKKFRETGDMIDRAENQRLTAESTQRNNKNDLSRKVSGIKKKVSPQRTVIKKNISKETIIPNTSRRKVTRSKRAGKNVGDERAPVSDDREVCVEDVKVEPLSEYSEDEVCNDSISLEIVKEESLSEYTENEVYNESVCFGTVKAELSEYTKDEVYNETLNGITIKYEPYLDEKPLLNEIKSENCFLENPKLLEDQIKKELTEDDETINQI